MTENTRATAHALMLEFIDDLAEHIENAHLINAIKTPSGSHCIEIARNISADKYIYMGVLFDMGFCWVTIGGSMNQFNLCSDEVEKIISAFEDYGLFE